MRTILIALLLAFAGQLTAQETQVENTLSDQFIELKSKSNNYQIYKVVKETSLDEFWSSVRDTIKAERGELQRLNTQVASLNKEVSELQNQVKERDSALEEQNHNIEHMSFLGMDLTKSTYITLTWILIFGLLIAALILYSRFHNAHKVTASTQREIETIQAEFDQHKQRTRENETKLKRDLQTEINRVEELKAQIEGNS